MRFETALTLLLQEVTTMDQVIVVSVSVGACIFLIYFLTALWREVRVHELRARVELMSLTPSDDPFGGGDNLLYMPPLKTLQLRKQSSSRRVGR